MKLTQEQVQVIDGLLKFSKPVQVLSGWAGTGKTTVIVEIIKRLPNFAVCAFTGKAAEVLRKKGIPASTIHSLIYTPVTGAGGEIIRDKHGNMVFKLADTLPCEGLIVDEASMVNERLYEDLLSFKLPIIFVGDDGQLEPIGSDVNVMSKPDFRLQQVHRNAGEIAHFAQWIREGYNPVAFATHYPVKNVRFVRLWESDRYLQSVDQVICAFNKTRVETNAKIRYAKNFPANQPVVGDRVMCLRNNRQIGLFNGMQGVINYLYGRENRMQFQSEEHVFDVPFDPGQFGRERYSLEDYHKDDPSPFDWCYCITAHKAQGDEWDWIMVFEQRTNNWDFRRWAYTAASRARVGIIWVTR